MSLNLYQFNQMCRSCPDIFTPILLNQGAVLGDVLPGQGRELNVQIAASADF
jgi:hypothetical protein